MSARRDVVAIVQPFVPSYRVGLFDAIADGLRDQGLELEVWHDQPKGIVAARGNATSGPWSVPITQHRLTVRRKNVTYRSIGKRAREVRAVVHGLASSNLETYGLARDPAVNLMLWGHGRNFTAGNNALDARLEKWLCSKATHIFAYTAAGADHLVEAGVEGSKVTVVRNSTDTRALLEARSAASPELIAACRDSLDLDGRRVLLFVGAYDEPKRLPFLIEAVDLMHAVDDRIVLLMAGAGPLDQFVADAAAERDHVRVLGRVDSTALGLLAHVVDLMVMPGRVGLVAVDSLALGVPLATTDHAFHAPEFDYLDDRTSLVTPDDAAAYAQGVHALLDDGPRRAAMSEAGSAEASELSVERAAQRFVAGILEGLE